MVNCSCLKFHFETWRWCIVGGKETFRRHKVSKDKFHQLEVLSKANKDIFHKTTVQAHADRQHSVKKLEKMRRHKLAQQDKLKRLEASLEMSKNASQVYLSNASSATVEKIHITGNTAMESMASSTDQTTQQPPPPQEWDDDALEEFLKVMTTKDEFEKTTDEQDFWKHKSSLSYQHT